jgi:iron complex transport system substrate-binding protein
VRSPEATAYDTVIRKRVRWLTVLLLVLGCSRDEARSTSAPGDLRIISLMPSGTEIVAALGATAQLVGVDEYSLYPPEAQALPKVGSFLSPNLEQIIKLRPSVVIVDDVHGRTAGALRDANIETIACAMHGLPDVKIALRTIGARIGKAGEADRLVAEIDSALDAAAARHPAQRPRVLAIIDREAGGLGNLVAAGPGSWIDELLAVAGGENVLAASGVRYPKVSLEEVLRANPDVILDLSHDAKPGAWQAIDVPATRQHRVVILGEPYLVAPSPRVREALAALVKAIMG